MLTQYTFRILVLALGLLTQIGSASGNQQFSIVIQPAHPTILPFEALALSVTVTNVSGAVVSHTCCGIHIQILNDAGQWEPFHADATPIASSPQGRKIFQPGESITAATYVDIRHGGKSVFALPGEVRLKIEVGELESPVVIVHVEEPSGQDKAMLAELQSSGLTNCLAVDAPDRYELAPEKLHALAELEAKFSGSGYADRAAVARGTYYIKGVNGNPDLPLAKRTFHELEAKSATAPTAAYYLGVIAMQEGDTSAAKRYIEAAQKSSSNPLIQQRVKYRLSEIERKQRE